MFLVHQGPVLARITNITLTALLAESNGQNLSSLSL